MAVVAEAYEAQTTITKATLPLLKNLVLLAGFAFMCNVTLVQVHKP
jgi:hypothetical protein